MSVLETLGFSGGTYANDTERERAPKALAEKCGYAAAALTIIPIPGTELVAVMPLHVGMVMGIGQIYGVELTKDSAHELILRIGATVGMSLMGSKLATTAAKTFLPGFGGLLGAPFMYASTQAIGTVARIYFQQQGDLMNEDMKAIYERSLEQAKQEFDPSKAKASDATGMAKAAAEGDLDQERAAAAPAADAAEGPAVKVTPRAEPAPAAPAAAAPSGEGDPIARLERLKSLLDKGLIDEAESAQVKRRILDGI